MQPKQLRIFQLFAEAVIPLYGIFFAHWTFSFLVYFYLIDLISYTIVGLFKIRKTKQFQNIKETRQDYFKIVLLSLIVCVVALLLRSIMEPTTISASFKTFFFTKEMSIPQGFLLIPLLFLSAWQQYKMMFVKMRLYETTNVSVLSKEMMVNFSLVLSFLAIAIAFRSMFFVSFTTVILTFIVARIISFLVLENYLKSRL
jgi:hypothetical protein